MIIEKNGKKYEVSEYPKHWRIVLKEGALSVDFNVPKEIAATAEDIKSYIETEKMF